MKSPRPAGFVDYAFLQGHRGLLPDKPVEHWTYPVPPLRSDAMTAAYRPDADEVLIGNECGPGLMVLTCIFLVELPGIESGTETLLTSENLDIQYAKAREMTGGDLRIRGGC